MNFCIIFLSATQFMPFCIMQCSSSQLSILNIAISFTITEPASYKYQHNKHTFWIEHTPIYNINNYQLIRYNILNNIIHVWTYYCQLTAIYYSANWPISTHLLLHSSQLCSVHVIQQIIVWNLIKFCAKNRQCQLIKYGYYAQCCLNLNETYLQSFLYQAISLLKIYMIQRLWVNNLPVHKGRHDMAIYSPGSTVCDSGRLEFTAGLWEVGGCCPLVFTAGLWEAGWCCPLVADLWPAVTGSASYVVVSVRGGCCPSSSFWPLEQTVVFN